MLRTGFLYDEGFLLHRPSPEHPETPERLKAVLKGSNHPDVAEALIRLDAPVPDYRYVEAVHPREYLNRFEECCLMGLSFFGHPDNEVCEESFNTAMLAAGSAVKAVRMVMEGKLDNAFCALRPPGHHATAEKAMGFCFLNNVAIAAKYLQDVWAVERIGIVDFDVHHGNGTQHIFETDPKVFFYSIHEHPTFSFPGSGREFERGTGPGFGYTLNSPMLPGSGDREYIEAIERDLVPAFKSFRPEFVLVSAGFDAHVDDDMSDIRLTTRGFSDMMMRIMDLAADDARGRVVSILEGGYCIERLPELTSGHLKVLLGIA